MIKNKISFNLSFKFVLITIFLIVILTSIVLSTALSLFFINAQSVLMKDSIESKGKNLAKAFASSIEFSVLSMPKEILVYQTRGTIDQEDVLYCVVYDKNCDVL